MRLLQLRLINLSARDLRLNRIIFDDVHNKLIVLSRHKIIASGEHPLETLQSRYDLVAGGLLLEQPLLRHADTILHAHQIIVVRLQEVGAAQLDACMRLLQVLKLLLILFLINNRIF